MSKKISELTAKTVYNDTDLVLISTDNGATFSSEKTTIADLRNALIGVQPKRYKALISQSGDGTSTQTSGALEIGKRYAITTYIAGDDFSNVARVVSETINTTGCEFVATGTTPTTYTNGSTLTDTSAPTAIVLENTLGEVPTFSYVAEGEYKVTCTGVLTINKTVIKFGNNYSYSTDFLFINSHSLTIDDFNFLTFGSATVIANAINNCLLNTLIEIEVYE